MAWGKSEEEKRQEQLERQRQEAERAALLQQQADARAAAAFDASPLGRSIAARERGDTFFQVELAVSELRGSPSFFGSSSNSLEHTGVATDLLGQIEQVGWHLEHTGFVFIETGSTSTNRLLNSGEGVVTQGNVTGIYLFRRVDPA